ncbi:DUF4956 domain-containing protein [Cryobacterium frigoriphilum]|uniref:DUF4956 domain-containing protein n=1 Tax=Cryobacterium frigoriphilum TaxID=1259150 RepID=A0A4R9A8K2_9MICO|nr:DUF4956 domain-containing protein [Cryobacterium frigoriphilum]TFD53961.1 DUF4956 domain-containing protein [Cryobacterium frigoriphilum]
MLQYAMIAIDLCVISLLTFGLYFPRHRRRDLIAAYLGVNVGVLAVAMVLASSAVGVGLGLGLFGVLSIIRLRSTEIEQHEVAYYFASLALGLLAGLSATATTLNWFAVALMGLIVAVMFVGDHPRLFRQYRQQTVVLERAIADETALQLHLTELLGARVHSAHVTRLDLVNDTTVVDVRYEVRERLARPAAARESAVTEAADAAARPAGRLPEHPLPEHPLPETAVLSRINS